MQYRMLGKTGMVVSRLAFGMRLPLLKDGSVDFENGVKQIHLARKLGINYFDTMDNYYNGQSEEALGKAMKGDRSNYIIQSKLASDPDCTTAGQFRKRLEEQLGRLQSDYLDVELMHNLHLDFFQKHGEAFINMAEKAKSEGLLRHVAFSSHDTPQNVHKIIDAGVFECMLVQYNLIDPRWEECIQHAHDSGLGVLVMGPVGGGRLAQPIDEIQKILPNQTFSTENLALRFVLANQNVDIALSGMQEVQFLYDNVKLASEEQTLSTHDYEHIQKVLCEKKELSKIYCTGCNYCMPCPSGVDIPKVFEYFISHKIYGVTGWARHEYSALTGKASLCTGCGFCEKKCPQHLHIIDNLNEAKETFEHGNNLFTITGIYNADDNWAWMSDHPSISFKPFRGTKEISFTLQCDKLANYAVNQLEASIFVNDLEVGHATFSHDNQKLPFTVTVSGKNKQQKLSIITNAYFIPAKISNSADERKLSLRIENVIIKTLDTTSELNATLQKPYENIPPIASIVIPVFNKVELTAQCIKALIENTQTSDFEFIFVDDASTDDTPLFLKGLSGNVKILTNQTNLGFSKSCNLGAKAANGKYLVFLNNDTIPLPGWLEKLLATMNSHPDAGVVGCKLLYPDNTVQHCGASMNHDGSFFRHQYKFLHRDHPLVNRFRELDAVTAACFITPRELFLKLGGFDEQYINGCEDMDYCTSVRNAGYKIYYNPESEMYHLESQTPRTNNKEKENFARYMSKWGAWQMKNEIEVYVEDGFWLKNLENYTPAPLAVSMILELTKDLPQQIADEVASRIFPVMQWEKMVHKPLRNVSIPSKLKILFVCHDFPPYKLAGAQLFALKTAHELTAMGHDVSVLYPVNLSARRPEENCPPYRIVTTTYEGLPVYEISVDDAESILYRHPQYCFDHPKVEDSFRSLLVEESFDIVHFHLLYRLSTRLPVITKELRIPSVATLHDYWLLCAMGHLLDTKGRECTGPESPEKCAACFNGFEKQPSGEVVTFFRERISAAKSGYEAIDINFSPSSFLADCHARYGFTRPEILPLGWIPVLPSAHLKTDKAPIVFGYLGQIIGRKGLDILLAASARIQHENWEIRIYGEVYQSDYFAPLYEFIRNHTRIHYCGPFCSTDLERLYADIDVAVVPSRRENYPLTVLEALSAKVPVIATDVGGVREIMLDGMDGLIVPPNDPDALCAAIERFIATPEMASKMRSTIRNVKTIKESASEYERVYRFLTAERLKKFA